MRDTPSKTAAMDTKMDDHDLFADHETGDDVPQVEKTAARSVALGLLGAVLNQKNPLDQMLDRDGGFKALPGRDKAFCRMLVATTLRRLGQIDDLIVKAQNKEPTKNRMLQNILRLGITQILFMDVPDHAAVDTSVRLSEAAGLDRQKGFVNGMLRTITRSGREWLERQDEARLNVPEWLLKLWIEDYDLGTAAQIAKANLAEAPLDITIKDEKDRNYWSSTFKASEIGAGTLRCPAGGPIHERPGFDDGMWWVQDASAAIPANLFGDVGEKTVVDMCAAPGGKTLQLAAKGAQVIAIDRSARRLERLKENLKRLRLEDNVDVFVTDAAEWKPKEPVHYILLDAPCSATGTIRRHPDVAHLKTPRDLTGLVDIQWRILDNAFQVLAPGGVLVYCTCSLQKAEGEAQIRRLFENYETAYKVPITVEEVTNMEEALTDQGDLRILPFHNAARSGMDGFYISRITKKE